VAKHGECFFLLAAVVDFFDCFHVDFISSDCFFMIFAVSQSEIYPKCINKKQESKKTIPVLFSLFH